MGPTSQPSPTGAVIWRGGRYARIAARIAAAWVLRDPTLRLMLWAGADRPRGLFSAGIYDGPVDVGDIGTWPTWTDAAKRAIVRAVIDRRYRDGSLVWGRAYQDRAIVRDLDELAARLRSARDHHDARAKRMCDVTDTVIARRQRRRRACPATEHAVGRRIIGGATVIRHDAVIMAVGMDPIVGPPDYVAAVPDGGHIVAWRHGALPRRRRGKYIRVARDIPSAADIPPTPAPTPTPTPTPRPTPTPKMVSTPQTREAAERAHMRALAADRLIDRARTLIRQIRRTVEWVRLTGKTWSEWYGPRVRAIRHTRHTQCAKAAPGTAMAVPRGIAGTVTSTA